MAKKQERDERRRRLRLSRRDRLQQTRVGDIDLRKPPVAANANRPMNALLVKTRLHRVHLSDRPRARFCHDVIFGMKMTF